MEGPILQQFQNLNALNVQKGPEPKAPMSHSSKAPMSARGPMTEHQQLLHRQKPYTSAENFIEDDPQNMKVGMAQLLPEGSSTEERDKLLRRLEMCAKAREESTKIMSIRFAQRDAVKEDMMKLRSQYLGEMSNSRRERDERWTRKLQRSPFAVDLVAENQRIDEENRVRDHVELRKQKLMKQRSREAHNAIFKRAVAESDELDLLRQEKRMLLEHEKELKALRDVEKSNARTAQILQERRRAQLEKQQKKIEEMRSREDQNLGPRRTSSKDSGRR
eukprot:gnl/MRDRNA2_/MRDRNA2_95022_c0_seq1.p1 gnl/MRDRNA2_/MRDRNA2_95022_c0~~gnl/MRDRNA2_/MRDRNA2_95022_c0_seq1.p1  ORF type:complete len:276 (+),score=70.89 gnl/MRDRNA2_/MRDRNA2_95022_c0_seq1:94-921(+)